MMPRSTLHEDLHLQQRPGRTAGPNLTLPSRGTTYNFNSLYVTGNLTLTGNVTVNSTALYVSGDFTISGPTSTNRFGPIYVGGIANWNGGSSNSLSVQTTTLANIDPATAGPMYAKILTGRR